MWGTLPHIVVEYPTSLCYCSVPHIVVLVTFRIAYGAKRLARLSPSIEPSGSTSLGRTLQRLVALVTDALASSAD